ncbi:MAG: aconitate hydratase AcnA [Deltaproteobacteria bacterium]|nr:aconitate hydratase AcnA [Deltaproteobacteria bacterium]
MFMTQDYNHSLCELSTPQGKVFYYKLPPGLEHLPISIKVLLEAALRRYDNFTIRQIDIDNIANWRATSPTQVEIPFQPARVVMQDFTGVPAVVDLATMRDSIAKLGGDPKKVNPLIPVDLVVDHSVQVDFAGSSDALGKNTELEFNRNQERYEFLKWGQESFQNFRVVPPATGIIHQVNLEYLASVVIQKKENGKTIVYPDSLVGTDSHTTMINGLGVVAWGVGGIEAEAVMLGQPIYMLLPEVVGVELAGVLPVGTTATDLVLTITQLLRQHGVVGKFVEFFGEGLKNLSLADRATIANMAPEYGATMGFFPVDEETLRYMQTTGRSPELISLTKAYLKAQGMFREENSPVPHFSSTVQLNLATVEPSLAGPKRPQDRISLKKVKASFLDALKNSYQVSQELPPNTPLRHGNVVIAAITSCTNTSNPSVMLGAGLLAKKAQALGLKVPPFVKTSLAPGSRVVTRYLELSGLIEPLGQLGFQVVGYGCTTCIGNSGPLPDAMGKAIRDNKLVVAGVLSGNRNFEGRIHPWVQANYLASPPLVVAYALAGRIDIDFDLEPLGKDQKGKNVYLKDLWPTPQEIQATLNEFVTSKIYQEEYKNVFHCNDQWNQIKISKGDRYTWQSNSTYIRKPTFFDQLTASVQPIKPIGGARVLAMLGDSVTTDHISPAGSIAEGSPAAQYLLAHGVQKTDWNSYGARRGNHEVMMRGTLANIRIKNELVPGITGGFTKYFPTSETLSIYEASERYQKDQTPLVIIAGKEYGTGSSRDWAAKGVFLLGVKAVIAESFERIHRSNLVGMGVLPLQFREGESRKTLNLTGEEILSIPDLNDSVTPGQYLSIVAQQPSGEKKTFQVKCRIDTPVEVNYLRNGGILHTVLRQMAK